MLKSGIEDWRIVLTPQQALKVMLEMVVCACCLFTSVHVARVGLSSVVSNVLSISAAGTFPAPAE